MNGYDVVIIGGGILGAFTARELGRYKLRVLVAESAYDVGEGAAKGGSGVLYPGFHPRGGSLKGISCVQGNRMYDAICETLGVSLKRIGALFVAFHPDGEETLREKFQRGMENGAEGMELLSGDRARALEPLLSPKVTKALYAPGAGILSPFELILAVSHSAHQNGVEFSFDTQVTGMQTQPDRVVLETSRGRMEARFVVNTAGGNAAELESWVRPQELMIKPRRGQYYVFDRQTEPSLRHVLFQAQESDEGGTLLTPTVEGNLLAGPTGENVRSYRKVETTRAGLEHVERVAKKLAPGLDMGRVIGSFAGVRTNIANVAKEQKDFVIRKSGGRMVSALGIKNPGMTAAPYLARKLVSLLEQQGLALERDPAFRETAQRQRPFLRETAERQRELFARDPRYAKVICRCEGITEGDVIHALRSSLPPRSLNGLKKRLRVGMGRCQGAFCTARILEIMSRELGCEPWEINKGLPGSNLIKGSVKP